MLENQHTVHLFSKPYLFQNAHLVEYPVDTHSNGETDHCDVEETTPDFGDVIIYKNGLANTILFLIVQKKYNVSYKIKWKSSPYILRRTTSTSITSKVASTTTIAPQQNLKSP